VFVGPSAGRPASCRTRTARTRRAGTISILARSRGTPHPPVAFELPEEQVDSGDVEDLVFLWERLWRREPVERTPALILGARTEKEVVITVSAPLRTWARGRWSPASGSR
jgi:hypothetical protein